MSLEEKNIVKNRTITIKIQKAAERPSKYDEKMFFFEFKLSVFQIFQCI